MSQLKRCDSECAAENTNERTLEEVENYFTFIELILIGTYMKNIGSAFTVAICIILKYM